MIDQIIYTPPKVYIAKDAEGNLFISTISVLWTLFDPFANTSSAYDLLRKPAFNVAMKDLLDSWGQYLTTEDSNSTLTDKGDGWFQELSLKMLEENRGVFHDTYVTPDPNAINRVPVPFISPKTRPSSIAHASLPSTASLTTSRPTTSFG